jgi:hypothetical protein
MHDVLKRGRRGRAWLACACLPAIVSAQSAAQSPIPNPPIPPGPIKAPIYQVAHTDKPPKIDGILDDPCWKTATHINGFYRFHSADPIKEQTEAWMCADASHLYIAFHCLDSHPELIKTSETQREGDLSHDDYVLVAIDSQTNRRNVSQFNVSARGTQLTQLEGGTANNLTWAGDWLAATHRTPDGWTAEISIPFKILRYPRGAKAFGIALLRQLARETNAEIWPYVPPEGNNNPMPYISDCRGIEPPYYPPHVVALPYVLGSAGATNTLHAGIDVKYPISTTLTGIASLFPDFQTVEDAVQNLSFSYTEKYLPDSRPFFVEGNQYLGDTSLFYSQRIPMVDEGAKVVGKQGPTTVYALATNAREDGGGQSALLADVSQDLGLYSQVGFAALSNNTAGQQANRLERVFGQYGFDHKGRDVYIYANDTESQLAGGSPDRSDYAQIQTAAGNNKPYATMFYSAIGPSFVNQLGLIPLVDLKGEGFNVGQTNQYDKGRLEYATLNLSANTYRHETSGFLQDDINAMGSWSMRSGWGYSLTADWNKFYPYIDNTVTAAVSWGQKTLFRQGSLSAQIGNEEDLPYRYITLGQGVLVSKLLSLNAMLAYESLGGQVNTQTILTGTYRLNSQETIGGRIVQQNGDIDVFLSYSRRLRHGTDIFILVGDPNSPQTRGLITVKLVRPL